MGNIERSTNRYVVHDTINLEGNIDRKILGHLVLISIVFVKLNRERKMGTNTNISLNQKVNIYILLRITLFCIRKSIVSAANLQNKQS